MFQNAKTLRIREWEYRALLDLVPMLAHGELQIDMRRTGLCLGSRVALIGGRDPAIYMGLVFSPSLRSLYLPGLREDGGINLRNAGWSAGANVASIAILDFLRDGRVHWDTVFRRSISLAS